MTAMDQVVYVRLTKAAVDEIDQMAEAEERDRSSMVRILLRESMTARQYAAGQRQPKRKDA